MLDRAHKRAPARSSSNSSLSNDGSAGIKSREIVKSGAIGRRPSSPSAAVGFGPISIAEYDAAKPVNLLTKEAPPIRFGPMSVDEYDAVKPLRRTSSGRILIVSDDDTLALFSPGGRRYSRHSVPPLCTPNFSAAFETSQTLPAPAPHRRSNPLSRHGFSLGSAPGIVKQLLALRSKAAAAEKREHEGGGHVGVGGVGVVAGEGGGSLPAATPEDRKSAGAHVSTQSFSAAAAMVPNLPSPASAVANFGPASVLDQVDVPTATAAKSAVDSAPAPVVINGGCVGHNAAEAPLALPLSPSGTSPNSVGSEATPGSASPSRTIRKGRFTISSSSMEEVIEPAGTAVTVHAGSGLR